jgi:hypothetical protein
MEEHSNYTGITEVELQNSKYTARFLLVGKISFFQNALSFNIKF